MTTFQDMSQDIADSTDWLSTPLAPLAQVEAALRCQVCKEFYDTPMITNCSHTFCSRCIRRCLSNEGKCPACRGASQEHQLRSNWGMEELVIAFKAARGPVLQFVRATKTEPPSKKRKIDVPNSEMDGNILPKRLTRSSSRLNSLSQHDLLETSLQPNTEADAEVVDAAVGPTEPEYQSEDGLVPCPMCNRRMKEAAVFLHLDHCNGETSIAPQRSSDKFHNVHPPISFRQSNSPTPLPSISYGLMKDATLRKKLQELGISNTGSRHLLEQRHKEWVTIWNANCDAAKPRRKGELLQDLSAWERTLGGRAALSAQNPGSDIRNKDFDRETYSIKHGSNFNDLAANARRSIQAKSNSVSESDNTASMSPTIADPGAKDAEGGSPESGLPIASTVQGLTYANTEMMKQADAETQNARFSMRDDISRDDSNSPFLESPALQSLTSNLRSFDKNDRNFQDPELLQGQD